MSNTDGGAAEHGARTSHEDECDCGERVDRLEERVDSFANVLSHLTDQLEDAQAERDEMSRELDVHRRKLDDIEDATSMLNDIKTGDSDVRKQRMAKILLTLRNELERKGSSATMDAGDCHTALNREPDRTTMYGLMEDMAEHVDSDSVQYVKEPKSAKQNTRIVLNEDKGTVPTTFEGYDVTGEEVA